MKIDLYHVDAFTTKVFTGNPAAVCVLPQWLPDEVLHHIAKENNLPVTAFLVSESQHYAIRWITPDYELDLCGHGSLAASHVIFNLLDPSLQEVKLHSRLEVLPVMRKGHLSTLNFPAKLAEPCTLPLLESGLGCALKETYQFHHERCMAVLDSEETVRQLKPDMQILKQLPHLGITVTARGKDVDFVSRTFYPKKSISEDPATGASHCLLAPYWAGVLNKNNFHAKQVSERGGEMHCEYRDDRVLISGQCVLYLNGAIKLSL